tara:strand:- start:560 stop:1273 length:714 start_codon:yes stop_codon:yes gene_type:complete
MKKLLFIFPLLYYSCNEDILADIEALETANIEQDAQIDSLLTVITTQQEYIDSMNNVQNAYIDSLIGESSLNDSLLQVYTDSLNTVQNTLNTDQQAYIDSLHNAQQTTLTTLANSALSAGFVETEVFSGTLVEDSWTDLDLSSIVGLKKTLLLLKVSLTCSECGGLIWFKKNGDSDKFYDFSVGQISSSGTESIELYSAWERQTSYALILTDSNGIIEYGAGESFDVKMSVVFYLNQ